MQRVRARAKCSRGFAQDARAILQWVLGSPENLRSATAGAELFDAFQFIVRLTMLLAHWNGPCTINKRPGLWTALSRILHVYRSGTTTSRQEFHIERISYRSEWQGYT
jgi:hypothetical protein